MSEASLDVAALRAALAKATPGPWARRDQYVRTLGTEPDYVAESWKYADAELIVLLRNNAEVLLDALAETERQGAAPGVIDKTHEPPVGTWVRDRFGGTSYRQPAGWGEPGVMPFGVWEKMWEARGPYVVCGPWGADL